MRAARKLRQIGASCAGHIGVKGLRQVGSASVWRSLLLVANPGGKSKEPFI